MPSKVYPIGKIQYSAQLGDNIVDYSKLGGGTYKFVEEKIVSGSATQTISFTGLDLDTDDHYVLFAALAGDDAQARDVSLGFNTDYTIANYYVQFLAINDNALTAQRHNGGTVGSISNSRISVFRIDIMQNLDGYPLSSARCTFTPVNSILTYQQDHAWNNTANITSIQLWCHTGAHIAVGGKATLYKLKVD
jgi:hypothetical protein